MAIDPGDGLRHGLIPPEDDLEGARDLSNRSLSPNGLDGQGEEVLAPAGPLGQPGQRGLDSLGIAAPLELGQAAELGLAHLGIVHPQELDRGLAAWPPAVDAHHHLTTGVDAGLGAGRALFDAQFGQALLDRKVDSIILTRTAVEAGEKLGFLPGDLEEKVNPYLRPLFDALYDMVDLDRAARMIEKGIIEIAPIAFMRGRTLSHSFVILDAAQNTTIDQMKMFLTRLGFDSKAVVTGDITQVDLPYGKISGLHDAIRILKGVEGIGMVEFTEKDVVRHPLVRKIIQAYEKAEKK